MYIVYRYVYICTEAIYIHVAGLSGVVFILSACKIVNNLDMVFKYAFGVAKSGPLVF